MRVSRSRLNYSSLVNPINSEWNCPEVDADLVILGVTFDAKITFEKHLCSVSRAAAQRLCNVRNSGKYLNIDRSF